VKLSNIEDRPFKGECCLTPKANLLKLSYSLKVCYCLLLKHSIVGLVLFTPRVETNYRAHLPSEIRACLTIELEAFSSLPLFNLKGTISLSLRVTYMRLFPLYTQVCNNNFVVKRRTAYVSRLDK